MIPFPENVVLVHVVHKDQTLPHFQARLPGQEMHNGKRLVFSFPNLCFLTVLLGTHVLFQPR